MKKLLLSVLIIFTLIMELLPFGAVLNFANPDGEPIRKTYSYFSPVPYGYANFAPLIVAALTVALAILTAISLGKFKLRMTIGIIASIAAALSLLPLIMLGVRGFSLVGAIISVSLSATAALSFIVKD